MHSQPQRPLEIQLELPVRTYDIDFAGIVNNIVFVRWLEDLRLAILDAHLPIQQQMADNVLAKINRPLRPNDQSGEPIARVAGG